MSNSRTVVHIQDLTDVSVGVDGQGQMHIMIGGEDEHQVEITASVSTLGALAGSVVDEMSGHVQALHHELARWVNSG